MPFVAHKLKTEQNKRKKPPPRPPPPNFSKYRSKSTLNLNKPVENLIEWSPPNSPKVERSRNFGGSVSSSFSSSTSSLASSKKSLEYESPISNNVWPVALNPSTSVSYNTQTNSTSFVRSELSVDKDKTTHIPGINGSSVVRPYSTQGSNTKPAVPPLFGPTIIRARSRNETKSKFTKEENNEQLSPVLPMPCIPPPSPPKDVNNVDVAYGIAAYDYLGTDPSDLTFQINDIVILLRRVNNEWYYGKVLDKEGMFPANFIEVQVPLVENECDNTVMALHEFAAQMVGDLALKPGQLVKVVRKINDDWLYGESNGQYGQFPTTFVDRVPNL